MVSLRTIPLGSSLTLIPTLNLLNKYFKRKSSKTHDEREEQKEAKHNSIYPTLERTSKRSELKKTTPVKPAPKKEIECVDGIKEGEYSRFFP